MKAMTPYKIIDPTLFRLAARIYERIVAQTGPHKLGKRGLALFARHSITAAQAFIDEFNKQTIPTETE